MVLWPFSIKREMGYKPNKDSHSIDVYFMIILHLNPERAKPAKIISQNKSRLLTSQIQIVSQEYKEINNAKKLSNIKSAKIITI